MTHANWYREKFSEMDEDSPHSEHEQCELLSAFGRIACAGSHCLQPPVADKNNWHHFRCVACDTTESENHDRSIHWDKDSSDESWKDVVAALNSIIAEDHFDKFSKPRILMAVAIRRIFTHISEPDYLDLEISPLGKWLINAMTRSLRELRIAAS